MDRYNSFSSFGKKKLNFLQKLLIFLIVLVYPILVSIYSMLPPLIGLVGYMIISNIDKNKVYALSGMLYLINVELNLTLPILLSIFVVIMIYIFFYNRLKLLIRCHVCLLFTLMVLIDSSYYLSLFLYDTMFQTTTVIADMLLVYYIVIDVFIGVLL